MFRPIAKTSLAVAAALAGALAAGPAPAGPEPAADPRLRLAQAARPSLAPGPRRVGRQVDGAGQPIPGPPGAVPHEDDDRRYRPRRRDRRDRAGQLLIITDRDYSFDERLRRLAPRDPEPEEPVAPTDAESEAETGPPDPGSPRTVARARGAAPRAADYELGAALPDGVPHVTLDWRTYGLPRPPEGLVYARVGRDVLLIDPATREVVDRVEPGGAEGG